MPATPDGLSSSACRDPAPTAPQALAMRGEHYSSALKIPMLTMVPFLFQVFEILQNLQLLSNRVEPGMMVHIYKPSTHEAEARGSL